MAITDFVYQVGTGYDEKARYLGRPKFDKDAAVALATDLARLWPGEEFYVEQFYVTMPNVPGKTVFRRVEEKETLPCTVAS